MNQKSASTLGNDIFLEQKISFAELQGQTKLFVDYQDKSEKLNQFYPTLKTGLQEFSKDVLANYRVDRDILCEILLSENKKFGVGDKTLNNIEELRKDDCVAVLTGQQAGLFSGPLYTFYKAFSAIKLAADLYKQGINAVPVFWIASEDHDFDEISKTFFIDDANNLNKVSNEPSNLIEDSPISSAEIDESINDSLNELFKNLPKTEFTDELKVLLIESYKTGESFSSAFGTMLARCFKDYGLIFVSPMNENLRKLCTPIYVDAVENSEIIAENLMLRDELLEKNNYHSQVLVEKDFFPFFYIDKDNKRNSLRFNEGFSKVVSQDENIQFTKQTLVEIAHNSPEK